MKNVIEIPRVVAPSVRKAVPEREWLHVTSHLDPKFGGIAAVVPELCAALSTQGTGTAALLGVCCEAETAQVPEPTRGVTRTLPCSRWGWLLPAVSRDRFTAPLAGADVVHIHGLWEEHGVSAARAARALNTPYVISAHGMLDPWALRNKRLKKAVYARLIENQNLNGAACLHALTVTEADDYRRFGARSPVAVIPNGVRVPLGVTADEFEAQFPELQDRRLVLYLGRIHYKKGLELLVRSWQRIAEQVPDAHLVLAGPDFENTRASVEREIAALGIGHRVTFTGMLSGSMKWSALAACELFVLPSYSEGLSMSVLEALGMAKPVVITRQCNVPQVAEYGCGWTIEPEAAALRDALVDALNSSSRRLQEMGRNGQLLVEQRFSWESVGARMRSVYEWILGGSQPEDVSLYR